MRARTLPPRSRLERENEMLRQEVSRAAHTIMRERAAREAAEDKLARRLTDVSRLRS